MSSNDKPADLLIGGEQYLTNLINTTNGTSFVYTDLVIGSPAETEDDIYNTDIDVTFPVAPTPGDPAPAPVTGTVHYGRFDLGRLFSNRNIRIHDNNYATTHALLAPLLNEARLAFEPDDIVDSALSGPYPRRVVLKAAPLSLRFIGQFSLEIAEAVTYDASVVSAVVVTEGTKPSQKALKTDGTLIVGEHNSAEQMIVATNGELEIAGAARLLKYNGVFKPTSSAYYINVADNDDWTLPFSFLLKNTKNADRVTDLYDCFVKVTSVEANSYLNFQLKRQYGKLLLEDTTNQITITDPAAYNEQGSLYQDLLRPTYYRAKFGSIAKNALGAPYGTFEVELKAVSKNGGADVVVAFTVHVDGLPDTP